MRMLFKLLYTLCALYLLAFLLVVGFLIEQRHNIHDLPLNWKFAASLIVAAIVALADLWLLLSNWNSWW